MELGIQAVALDKVIVPSPLHDLALVQNEDEVG